MERPIILSHLLNSGINPFNRQPLTKDMLTAQPATELKDWNEVWKDEKRMGIIDKNKKFAFKTFKKRDKLKINGQYYTF